MPGFYEQSIGDVRVLVVAQNVHITNMTSSHIVITVTTILKVIPSVIQWINFSAISLPDVTDGCVIPDKQQGASRVIYKSKCVSTLTLTMLLCHKWAHMVWKVRSFQWSMVYQMGVAVGLSKWRYGRSCSLSDTDRLCATSDEGIPHVQ